MQTEYKCGPLAIREVGGLMFFYPGIPMARPSGIKQGWHSKVYTHYKEGLGWAAKAAALANGGEWVREHLPMKGRIVLGAVIFRIAPPTNKPDLDNYLKLIADAFTGVIYADDAQVVEYFPGSRKESSETQGIRIIIVPQLAMEKLGFEDLHSL